MKKNKKALLITAVVLDVIITVTLLVISIIMLVKTVGVSKAEIMSGTGFIAYLQQHPNVYLIAFVIPLFLILAANIIGLVVYVKKTTKAEPVQINDLSEEQKALIKQQLLADMMAKQNPPAETKTEEKSAEVAGEAPKATEESK